MYPTAEWWVEGWVHMRATRVICTTYVIYGWSEGYGWVVRGSNVCACCYLLLRVHESDINRYLDMTLSLSGPRRKLSKLW
jgi:hypothetical protein